MKQDWSLVDGLNDWSMMHGMNDLRGSMHNMSSILIGKFSLVKNDEEVFQMILLRFDEWSSVHCLNNRGSMNTVKRQKIFQ
ncbi:CLUMA_CG014773, isoform A [Clunio marinus]|uniref:CLUMA_CG014773, isoform A n=1 Tax=Clunio marinus TaxID=568069 RepID=A0A1J1ILF0_9DIPT|nr:CLUMA_CG014773, isoform A [Clunio marinus]